MIFGIHTTRDISKLFQISLALWLMKLCITILKYHSWYLCRISLQIMLLPILIDSMSWYHVLEHVFYTMRATNLTHLSWFALNYCQNLRIRYKIKPL